MTQVTKMLIQANTLQLTYLLYIVINVSNLAAYMSLFPCCHSVQYGIELFNYELIVKKRGERKEEKKVRRWLTNLTLKR